MCQPMTQTQVKLLKYRAAPGAPSLKDALWLLHSRRETSNKSVPAHQHISFQFFKVFFFFFFQICSYFPPSVIKVEWPIQSLHRARMCGHQAQVKWLSSCCSQRNPIKPKAQLRALDKHTHGAWERRPWSEEAAQIRRCSGEPGAGAHTLSGSISWPTGRNGWPLRIPLWNKRKPTWLT